MPQTAALIKTLKKTLKQNHLTYAQLAASLDMSEANVKRMFSSGSFSLQRIEDICIVMQMELSDLFQLYEESRQRITTLTRQQEKELVSNSQLLLVAVSVRNQMRYEEIIERYAIEPTECIRCLARLDKLKIIDLLPGNRIKLRIDENFHWLPKGPIEKFFELQLLRPFMDSGFDRKLEKRMFQFGLLSNSSAQIILSKMETLVQEFTDLHRKDARLPPADKNSIGLLIALRPWEVDVFKPYIK